MEHCGKDKMDRENQIFIQILIFFLLKADISEDTIVRTPNGMYYRYASQTLAVSEVDPSITYSLYRVYHVNYSELYRE